jgi:hypothetical protein
MMMTPNEWDAAERDIVRAWTTGAARQAIQEIERVLERGDDEQRGRALMYRGSIHEETSNWQAARDDFIQAVGLLSARSYQRYAAELSVGHACEKAGETQDAVKWYRAALLTCAGADEPFSGGTALKGLLALAPELSVSDLELARTVTAKSWHVMNLPNEPNLDDLAGTAEIVMQRASDPKE